MIVNNFKLAILFLALVIIQILVNNFTVIYIDNLALVLVVLLLSGRYSWIQLIVLSLIADLIGHWYLGSHLLAITLLSMFSANFANFYKVCNGFQRSIITGLFYLGLIFIIYLISLATSRVYVSFSGLFLSLIVILPLVQMLINRWLLGSNSDYIFYD